MKRALLILALLLTAVCLLTGAAAEDWLVNLLEDPDASYSFDPSASVMEIVIPQIANADACIIRLDGKVMLLDAGGEENAESVLSTLEKMGISHIDIGLNTHPHPDHVLGYLSAMDAGITMDKMIVGFGNNYTAEMKIAVPYMEAAGVPMERAAHLDELTLAGIGDTFRLYQAYGDSLSVNNKSFVIHLTYGERTILFCADTEKEAETWFHYHSDNMVLRADIIRYPHHGVRKMYLPYYEKIQPSLALVTNTEESAKLGAAFLKSKGIPGVYTGEQTVRLRTDGKIWVLDTLD